MSGTPSAAVAVPRAVGVTVTDDTVSVDLEDGRTISVPIGWVSSLGRRNATGAEQLPDQRTGYGVHWPDLDEDIGVEGLLLGRKSTESPASFQRWMARRTNSPTGS